MDSYLLYPWQEVIISETMMKSHIYNPNVFFLLSLMFSWNVSFATMAGAAIAHKADNCQLLTDELA